MKRIAQIHSVGCSAYVAPDCVIVEIDSEGLLCQSGLTGGGFHENLEGDDSPII